jgi:uncharacterized OB-fold protein
MDAIRGGTAKKVLVVASDCRLGAPKGTRELFLGDGAAALLLSSEDVIASIEGSFSLSDEMMDQWRSHEDIFVRSSEDRFALEEGCFRIIPEVVTRLCEDLGLRAQDFSRAVFYAHDSRSHRSLARMMGFDAKTQASTALFNSVGNTGAALALMMLVEALENSSPGERVLFAGYGDGADAFALRITDEIRKLPAVRGIGKHLSSGVGLGSYQKYLSFRRLIETEAPRRPPLEVPSPAALFRDRRGGLALYGNKCKQCGTPQYPVQRVCVVCQAKDHFEDYRFSDKKGKIFTFTNDNLAAAIEPPTTVAVIDFDGGGRMACDMTDRTPDGIEVGMPVEMTFRKLYTEGGIHNYWWKARPVRC